MKKNNLIVILLLITIVLSISACSKEKVENKNTDNFDSFKQVEENGKNKEVSIFMWGGNENINKYMDNYIAKGLKEKYGIRLKRIPMNAPEFISKLLNEKKGKVENGTADIIWINGENFKTAKEGKLIWGPFTHLLPNLKTYYEADSDDLKYDTGTKIDGYEGIWGRAQLVLTYDSAVLPNPPNNFKELKTWVKKNPGKFTFPKLPDDFVGVAFVRTAYYELTGEKDIFQNDMSKEEFMKVSRPVIEYFKEINPYLWQDGEAFPPTQAKLDELFKNGEIAMTIGFEVGKTEGLIKSGLYPDSVRTYVFDTGTIGNSHYLAIPFNSKEKAAAMLVINYLESPDAQIEKAKASVWGDMSALDASKLTKEELASLDEATKGGAMIPLKTLSDNRLPEMKSKYIEWVKEIWLTQIVNQ